MTYSEDIWIFILRRRHEDWKFYVWRVLHFSFVSFLAAITLQWFPRTIVTHCACAVQKLAADVTFGMLKRSHGWWINTRYTRGQRSVCFQKQEVERNLHNLIVDLCPHNCKTFNMTKFHLTAQHQLRQTHSWVVHQHHLVFFLSKVSNDLNGSLEEHSLKRKNYISTDLNCAYQNQLTYKTYSGPWKCHHLKYTFACNVHTTFSALRSVTWDMCRNNNGMLTVGKQPIKAITREHRLSRLKIH